MKDIFKVTLTVLAALTFSSCTTGETLEGEEGSTEQVAEAANTDVVPELTDPMADPNAPVEEQAAADPNAAPVEEQAAAEPAGIGAAPEGEAVAQVPAEETPAEAAPLSPELNAAPVSEAPKEEVAASQSTGESRDYEVQPGDTLMRIAYEVYGDVYKWRSILDANSDKLKGPNSLSKGMTLKVDKTDFVAEHNGEKYLIKWGDTLGTISDDVYGTNSKWKRLWENNRQLIKDPNKIFAGFYLFYEMNPQDQQEKDQFSQQKRQPATAAQGG